MLNLYEFTLMFLGILLLNSRHYGFIGYCKRCGHSQAFSWDELGGIDCPCDKSNVWLHPSMFVFLFEIEPEITSNVFYF